MKLKLMFLVVLACVGLIAALISPVVRPTSARTDMTMTSDDDDDDDDDDGNISESRIRRGLAIAPVPLKFRRSNRALVGLGSYIVNAQGDCNGCHTTNTGPFLPGGNPFVGEVEAIDPDKYLVGGTNFGPFISRNLRPRPDTGLPAGLTFERFLRVLRTGADLKHIPPTPPGDLLQVMPWPAYANMKNQDIRAIYEYLKALPPHPGYPQ